MAGNTANPTHFRLLSALKAVGPYLREKESQEGHYLFDCLSVCVSDKKSPEEREFWGWWLEFDKQDEGYVANYSLGLYNVEGNWEPKVIPKKAQDEVTRTMEDFDKKLKKALSDRFEINYELHNESVEVS
ncbi:sigma factor-binding protein Crl [Vibrio sp. S9_S30]|uniref:sigma factor-binding protein Crl n=1 Tax=Vibrio sp. S9_S30 TaxID=2720226 RepID=UPI00168113F6|nr:sigma factor-binding protein Crl [Vibrio sp. S9_S30]MBD1555921.1 sigma factor-binding protein Crl [Vibrio sp. S9_S30]